MEITLLHIIDDVVFLLPLLESALSDGNIELAFNLFSRINPWLLDILLLVDPAPNSNLDVLLRGLVETGGVISQFLHEVDGSVCGENQLSAVRSIKDALREIRPIVTSSTADTLNQDLENFLTHGAGSNTRSSVIFFYSLCVGIAIAAGLFIPVDLPGVVPLLSNQ